MAEYIITLWRGAIGVSLSCHIHERRNIAPIEKKPWSFRAGVVLIPQVPPAEVTETITYDEVARSYIQDAIDVLAQSGKFDKVEFKRKQ